MVAQVKKWGNSQGIRLPKELLQLAGIQTDDLLEVQYVDGDIILSKQFKHRSLKERAIPYGGKLGPYEEGDFGGPQGRERWSE